MPRGTKKKKEEKGLSREGLLTTLNKLKPGLASKDVVEQATSFVFADGMAWSYNDEIACSIVLPEEVDIEGAVPADPLLKLLSKGKASTVEIFMEEGELRVHCGRSRAGLALEEAKLPVSEIPMPGNDDWSDLPKNFLHAVSLTVLACSMDMSAPILTCLSIGKDSVQASDGFRITWYKLKGMKEAFLLPAAAAKHLGSFKPEASALAEGWVHFINAEDAVLSCRTVMGKYPDITPHLKVKGEEMKLPKELNEILDRAGVFADAEFEQDEEVEMNFDDGVLLVSARGENGWIKEEVEIEGGGASFSITVNPSILQAALKLNHTCVIGESAMLIQGKDFKHVVSLV